LETGGWESTEKKLGGGEGVEMGWVCGKAKMGRVGEVEENGDWRLWGSILALMEFGANGKG
tara:strand:+ start:4217 stop:4399 length:183 start_codon:yes stop_codon:yes gene_type:complete